MGKVDDFIVQNFAKIVEESVEFTQLPCVKVSGGTRFLCAVIN
jgi:hypothetical protein